MITGSKTREYLQSVKRGAELVHKGDISGGLKLLEEMTQAFPREAEGLWELGSALVHSGQFQKGISVLERAVLLCPHDPNLHRLLGYAFFRVKEYPASAASYRTALSLMPNDVQSLKNLAEVYRVQGRVVDALRQIGQALMLVPDDASLLKEKARLSHQLDTPSLVMPSSERTRNHGHEPSPLPHLGSVNVEVTTYCNFSCAGCLRTVKMEQGTWKNRHLSLEEFRHVMEGMPTADEILLWGVGEPSLHPHLPEMIACASSAGKFARTVLTSDISARDITYYVNLFDHGLSHLIVSIDTLDQELADQVRRGTKVETLEGRLRTLLQHRPGLVDIRTVVSRKNYLELLPFFERLNRIGILRVHLQPYDDLGNPSGCLTWEELAWVSNHVPKIAPRFTNLSISMGQFLPSPAMCTRPWRDPFVTADGHLTPCCRLTDSQVYSFGNIMESSFMAVFNSDKARAWREDFIQESPAVCDGCQMHIPRRMISKGSGQQDLIMVEKRG